MRAITTGCSSNHTYTPSLAKKAQQQVPDQGLCIWIGIFKLALGDGSVAYQKSVVNSF
jgi:hypothetical protein